MEVSLKTRSYLLPLDVAIDLVVVQKEEKEVETSGVTVKMIRPITRLEQSNNNNSSKVEEIDIVGGVMFGIGQSLASRCCLNENENDDENIVVVACVGGLFPNAVGHTAQIFVSTTMDKAKFV